MADTGKIYKKVDQKGNRDHPEQYPTDNASLFDLDESMMNVDPIPMEDLTMEKREEKKNEETKHNSSSEKKYHSGFEKE